MFIPKKLMLAVICSTKESQFLKYANEKKTAKKFNILLVHVSDSMDKLRQRC